MKQTIESTILNPELKTLFSDYNEALLRNHFQFFKSIIPAYGIFNPPKKEKNFVTQIVEKSTWKVINFIENF